MISWICFLVGIIVYVCSGILGFLYHLIYHLCKFDHICFFYFSFNVLFSNHFYHVMKISSLYKPDHHYK